jgi:hypothetical protein
MIPAVEGRNHHDRGAARKPRTNEGTEEKKGSRTPKGAGLSSALVRCGARPAGRARLPAFHCGSCQGDCSSPRRNPGQSFLGLGGSLRVLRTANRGESRKHLHGRYPRPPVPVQRAPRAPVIVPAGMMPGPPERGSDKPPPAGTAPRSAGRSHPAGVLSVSEVVPM